MPMSEVFAAEYRLKASSTCPGKAISNTGFKLKQVAIGEPFGGEASNSNHSVKLGYIPSSASSRPRLTDNIPDGFVSGSIDLDDYFEDLEGGELVYSVTGNSSINVSIDPVTHTVTWSHASGFIGSEEIFFTAENSSHLQVRSNGIILATRAAPGTNNAPTLHHISDITEYEGSTISISALAYDIDGDTLTYTYTYPFDAAGQWQPDYNDSGTYTVTITVSDGQLSDSQDAAIAVINKEQAPVIESVNGIIVVGGHVDLGTKEEGAIIKLEPYAYDPDGSEITISYTVPFDVDGSWTIPQDFTGPSPIQTTINASDGNLSSSVIVNITVDSLNITPTVSLSIDPASVNTNTDFTIHIDAEDHDGDSLTYVLNENGSELRSGPIIESLAITEIGGRSSSGEYAYEITVTDSSGESASDVAYLEVINGSSGQNDVFPVSGDFNGDGLTDIGTWNKTNDSWAVSLSEDGNFNNIQTWNDIFGHNNYSTNRTFPIMGDFNGDSLTDIGLYDNDRTSWKFAFSDGDSFNYDNSWDIAKFGGGGQMRPLTGDFNGDGVTDIGYVDSSGHFCIKLAKEDKSGFKNTAIPYKLTSSNPTIYAGDFNGDGLTDILEFKKGSGNWDVLLSENTTSSQLIDFMQDTSISVTGDSSGKTYDGNWTSNLYGNHNIHYTFPNPVNLTQIHFNASASAYAAGWDPACSAGVRVIVTYADDSSDYIYNVYYGVGSGSASAGGNLTFNGNWNQVKKINLWVYSTSQGQYNGHSGYANEIQAWGPENPASASSTTPAFTIPQTWLSGFGANKEAVTRDFNHDGKTDVGYFDKNNGKWHVALSKGSEEEGGFDTVSGAVWPSTDSSGWPSGVTYNNIIPGGGDLNGDAIGDALAFDRSKRGVLNKWIVLQHNSKLPDLLVGIDSGIGGITSIEYEVSTQLDNTGTDDRADLPFPVRVVKKVTKSDGMGNSYVTRYEYKNGFFETGTREFRGFGHVKVTDPEGHHKETFFNQDDLYKGRPDKELVYDKYKRLIQEQNFSWQSIQYHSGKTTFPYLGSKTTTLYDYKTGASKQAQTSYQYDNYGNVINILDEGFLDVAGDERRTLIDYSVTNTSAVYISKPYTQVLQNSSGAKVSEARYYYDNQALGASSIKGSLTKEERWLNLPTERYIATHFSYDSCGNIETVTDSLTRVTRTTYEATKTYPQSVTNALSHTQRFTYEHSTGKILTSTDPNSQITTSSYDGFGRLTHVVGPGNISEVSYIYDLTFDLTVNPVRRPKIISITKVSSSENITNYSWIDGLGRTILARQAAEHEGQPKQIVSGVVKYNSRGQVIKKYLPYYADTTTDYVAPEFSTPHVSYEYDPLGRVVKTIRPDNKVSQNVYGVTAVLGINEDGQRKRSTKDAAGRIIKIEEFNDGQTYETTYEYDTLGNLIRTIDTLGNEVSIQYDSLGRKISMDDPDMGHWEYNYDDVGNLISQTDAKEQTITFEYDDINRLRYKSTGDFGTYYSYDSCPSYNYLKIPSEKIGRLTGVRDSSGATYFFYDVLGREYKTIKEIRGVYSSGFTAVARAPGSGTAIRLPAPQVVERTYDSLDRLTSVTYPDNTIVEYRYNKQGGIQSIFSPATGGNVYYVKYATYNANGQLEYIQYGNNSSTGYTYDPNNLRLEHLVTMNGNGSKVQDLTYNFDPVGNVTSIIDGINTNTQYFNYDDLNRLVSARGTSYEPIQYAYDPIGNITQKGNLALTYGERSYGPHAVTNVSGSKSYAIEYDLNGNITNKDNALYTYDIENRLTQVDIQRAGEVIELDIDLRAGWNFVSIPLLMPDNSISSVFASIEAEVEQISKYDASTGQWFHYVGNDKFNQFNTIEYGEGYLIYCSQACSLTITGHLPITQRTKDLKAGWNLIGSPTRKPVAVSEVLSNLERGVDYDRVTRYNLETQEYEDCTFRFTPYGNFYAMNNGCAYYIHCLRNVSWDIPLEYNSVTTFLYDGDGGRVERATNDKTTVYVGSSYELEIDKNTREVVKSKRNIFMGSNRICEVEQTSDGIHAYFIHADHIGSSNIITDETGSRSSLFEYTPFGSVAYADETNSYDTDKRFTGKTYDQTTGLYYYGARYYDPELGRFISADPTIQHPYDPQDFNRFAYARNNPAKYIDPTGLGFWSWLKSFFAGFVGAVAAVVLAPVVGPVFSGMIGGAISGAIAGAFDGGLSGALRGAMWGAALGGAMGAGYAGFDQIGLGMHFLVGAAVGGAAYSGVTGGGEGLANYAAGSLGAFYGASLGNTLIGNSTVNTSKSETAKSTGKQQVNKTVETELSKGNIVKTHDNNKIHGKKSPLENGVEGDALIARGAQKGEVGRGGSSRGISSLGKPAILPNQSELFWRGVAKDLQIYGKSSFDVGSKMGTAGTVFSLPLSPFKIFGRVIGGAGKIDITVGNFMEFTGRWMDAQFPDPYW